jgi:hypothetical protein
MRKGVMKFVFLDSHTFNLCGDLSSVVRSLFYILEHLEKK